MSTHQRLRLEKIEEVITKLATETAKGNIILVEGKNDAQAIDELGIKGSIHTLKTGGKSFLEICEEIQTLNKDVILLLDFDRRGKEATKRLQQELERSKVKVHTRLWHDLKRLIGNEVQCIEGLPSFLETLKAKSALN